MKTDEEKSCSSCGELVPKHLTYCYYCGKIFFKKCPDCGTEHEESEDFCPILMNKLYEEFRQKRWAWKVTRNIQTIVSCFLFLLLCGMFFLTPLVLGWISLLATVGFLVSIFVSLHFSCKEWEEKKTEFYFEALSKIDIS